LRRNAVDHHLHVVERPIGNTVGVNAAGVLQLVLACIPTPSGQIQTADECQSIVDNNNFLVMRAPDRQLVVEAKLDAMRRKRWRVPRTQAGQPNKGRPGELVSTCLNADAYALTSWRWNAT